MAASAYEVGKMLVELCNAGKSNEVIEKYYGPNIVSVEAMSGPSMPQRIEGIKAVKEKNEWWYKNHTVHSGVAEGPWPHGDKFIVRFKYDVTATGGPMQGKRMVMDETALYTVKDGKITQEEFFYHMG